jgi:chaperonin GroES
VREGLRNVAAGANPMSLKKGIEAAVEREEKTKSGIVLPDTAKDKPQEGIVEAVGGGRILDNGTKVPNELKVGDKVLFAKYAGNEFKLDDIDYLIISEKDVLAVVSSNGAN